MAIDEDIAASLPKPPPPAPARRDAAIGAAMARFDGAPAPTAPVREKARFGRTQIGVLVSAALVAFVGIPALWMSGEDPVAVTRQGAPKEAPIAETPHAVANDVAQVEPLEPAQTVVSEPTTKADAALPVQADADMAAPKEEERAEITVSASRMAPPPPPAPTAVTAADMVAQRPREADVPASQPMGRLAQETDNIVVTGAKVSRPAAARAKRAPERNDEARCTINDPARDLNACRGFKGARGQAGASLADGLSRAWRGDYDGAITDFSKAIAADPKSGIAYLNRGLAHRVNGDEAEAAADLKRARALGND